MNLSVLILLYPPLLLRYDRGVFARPVKGAVTDGDRISVPSFPLFLCDGPSLSMGLAYLETGKGNERFLPEDHADGRPDCVLLGHTVIFIRGVRFLLRKYCVRRGERRRPDSRHDRQRGAEYHSNSKLEQYA